MACGIAPVAPANDPCLFKNAVIGKQFVGLFYQLMTAVAPTMTSLAGIQAGLAAEGDDQLFILKNVAAATVSDPTDQSLTGNDVPYGGTIITERARAIVGQLQYLTPADVATNNELMAGNAEPKRVWWFDDLNVLQGPYENAYISVGGYLRAGAGTPTPNRQSITMNHRGLEEPAIGLPIAGLRSLQNAA